jgi:hypothetical protein
MRALLHLEFVCLLPAHAIHQGFTTIVTLDADPISPTFSVKSLSISPNRDGNQSGILWWRFGNFLHMDTRSLDLLDMKENIVIGVSQSSSEGLPVQ